MEQDALFAPHSGMTLAALLQQAPLDALENRLLLMHALGMSRIQLITQSGHVLDAAQAQAVKTLFQRRLAGEPIAYILGTREFYGLDFAVSPDVLIPRPDTELLVELALARLPQHGRILDMGTGSGAIAVALAHARRDAAVSALDVSKAALTMAQHNAARHSVDIAFMQSDWYAAIAGLQYDMIVANPPYIVAGDPHLMQGDLRFEPLGALTDHADGLSALRILTSGALPHLIPGGWLLMEHGYDQAAAVRGLLLAQGFNAVQSWTDLAGIERVSGGRLQTGPARA